MIVYVGTIRMGSHDESVPALGKGQRQFTADAVCLLRCDLPGFKRLTDLVGNHIAFLFPPGILPVLPFGEKKFLIASHGIAFVRSDQLTLFRLLRVLRIVGPGFQALRK